jgi:hypothetical protein
MASRHMMSYVLQVIARHGERCTAVLLRAIPGWLLLLAFHESVKHALFVVKTHTFAMLSYLPFDP